MAKYAFFFCFCFFSSICHEKLFYKSLLLSVLSQHLAFDRRQHIELSALFHLFVIIFFLFFSFLNKRSFSRAYIWSQNGAERAAQFHVVPMHIWRRFATDKKKRKKLKKKEKKNTREERESCGWPPCRLISSNSSCARNTAAKFLFFSFITCVCYISASDKTTFSFVWQSFIFYGFQI